MDGDRLVVLAGCNAIGLCLAARLDRMGLGVRVVAQSTGRAALLPACLADAAVIGDPLARSTMQRSELAAADALFATTDHDDRNAALALAGRRMFAIPIVAAHVADPGRAAAYGALGITTVCAETLTASVFTQRVRALAATGILS